MIASCSSVWLWAPMTMSMLMKEDRREQVRDRLAFRIANLKELVLTDQQVSQIKAIRAEYRPRVQEAGNRLRAIVREEIAAVVIVLKA